MMIVGENMCVCVMMKFLYLCVYILFLLTPRRDRFCTRVGNLKDAESIVKGGTHPSGGMIRAAPAYSAKGRILCVGVLGGKGKVLV